MADSKNKKERGQVAQSSSFIHRIPRPVGHPPRFRKPDDLWDKFVEYCDYIDENPWQKKTASNNLTDSSRKNTSEKKYSNNTNSMRQEVSVFQRAYTLNGFCAYAGIASKWADFKKTNRTRSSGFESVIMAIENVVTSQQLDGAMINQFNGSLVARLNGISDSIEQNVSAEFKFPKLSKEDLDELAKINGLK